MNKHTPGPWRYAEYFAPDGTSLGLSVYAGRQEVSRLPGISRLDYDNAQLLASAPALLAALRALYEDVERFGLHHPDGGSNFWSLASVAARDALAKATGDTA